MRLGPNLKQYLPRRLFARTILIILLPLLLAQAVAAWIFYDRHYTALSIRLAQATAADIDLLAEQAREAQVPARAALFKRWEAATGLSARYTAHGASTVGADDYLRRTLGAALTDQSIAAYRFGAVDENNVVLYLPGDADGTELAVRVPMRRLYTSTTLIFVLWMVGAAAVLVLVSLLFMRNQIRPIRRLAEAAEELGRNLDQPLVDDHPFRPLFKPEGAREVRQAAAAFLVMRNRLRRMIEQRTAMLAAISHDLRTPLTRMRLQLALMPGNDDTGALTGDIAEMERMIEAYLAFARGQDSEPASEVDLTQLVSTLAQQATRLGKPVWWQAAHKDQGKGAKPLRATLRPAAIARALNNLITNALKFGDAVWIAVAPGDYTVEVAVEDNGPGIPEAARETVFKPFFQMDSGDGDSGTKAGSGQGYGQGYSQGYGMGLTIARDIARAHGGDVLLSQSVHGGLKAVLRLPV